MIGFILGSYLKLRNLLLCPPALLLSLKQSQKGVLTTGGKMLAKKWSGRQMNPYLLWALPGPGTSSPSEWLRSEHETSRCTFGGLGLSDQSEFHSKLWDQPEMVHLCRTSNIRQEKVSESNIYGHWISKRKYSFFMPEENDIADTNGQINSSCLPFDQNPLDTKHLIKEWQLGEEEGKHMIGATLYQKSRMFSGKT